MPEFFFEILIFASKQGPDTVKQMRGSALGRIIASREGTRLLGISHKIISALPLSSAVFVGFVSQTISNIVLSY